MWLGCCYFYNINFKLICNSYFEKPFYNFWLDYNISLIFERLSQDKSHKRSWFREKLIEQFGQTYLAVRPTKHFTATYILCPMRPFNVISNENIDCQTPDPEPDWSWVWQKWRLLDVCLFQFELVSNIFL